MRIKEVARLAAVSTATVSRALASPDRVSPATRARVLQAVAQVGYVPNLAARTLRSQKTHMVLVVLPNIGNIFFSQVLRGVEETLFAAGYGTIIGNLDGSAEKEDQFAAFIAAGQVDGVLLLNGHLLRENGRTRDRGGVAGVPIVALCETIEGADIPQIEVDNRKAAGEMTRYLRSLGHEKIVHLMGPPENILEKARCLGYREAMTETGAGFDPSLVWPGDYTLASGVAAGRRLIAETDRPSAVFCSNDEMAIGLIQVLAGAGVRVPQDISVAGFDDIEYAEMASPPLTTIRQPRRELGRNGAAALLELLRGGSPSPLIRLETELIVRASTQMKVARDA